MSNEKKGAVCTFLWFIKKYSYCWHKIGEELKSPEFSFNGLEGTKWRLGIYPRGRNDQNTGSISVILCRSAVDSGPKVFKVNFELSFLAEDGSALHSKKHKAALKRDKIRGSFQFVERDEILLRRKADFLPNDTMSVRCVMWQGGGDIQSSEQIVARTRILTEHFSFIHMIENFSKLQENGKHKNEVKSPLNNTLTSCVYFVRGPDSEETITIEIVSSDASRILHKCKILLGHVMDNGCIECGGVDNGCTVEEKREHNLPLTLTRQAILSRKNEYLNKDKLLFLCECTFSTGLISYRIEETQHELPSDGIKQETDHGLNKNVLEAKENLFGHPSALDDMKALYLSQRFTDVQLKTKTKSFPAHKNFLCARSPIFEAMMTTDMKEKNTACIRVDDLENDTVEQLLLFLYSDRLENLQWESAARLYYAADKYQIGKLKAMCSSVLAENLNSSNAAQLLLLADTHYDSSLQQTVEDFILKHEEQVFGSDEWEKLIEANPLLVIKTMHLKYKRKK